MSQVILNGNVVDFAACVSLMDDTIREDLNNDYAGFIDEQEFLDAYVAKHETQFGSKFCI